MKKVVRNIVHSLLCGMVLFGMLACSTDGGSGNDGNKDPVEGTNPTYGTRNESLDFIFGTGKLGETKITIKRSEWNTLLSYYDINEKNEECVHADYTFEKGDKKWDIKDVGFRIRGNTSRCRPQYDETTYQQAHFKIDFEEWPVIVDGVETEREEKMSGCMKGVILKRCKDDYTYTREVFAYNYFRDCGVWTSPRAGYTRLLFDIVEDDGTVEKVDFGVYEMIENIDKQFLKARTTEEAGGNFNGNKGNLWKCTWKSGYGPNFSTSYFDDDFGVENVPLEGAASEFSYDLKTNKDKLSKAKTEIKSFIDELNGLDDSDVDGMKSWFDSKMNPELFLKTYAINVLLGMWDDYWYNSNNFYFYFDKDGKAYFIPYDYDNILGTNMNFDAALRDPLNWGSLDDGSKPLIQKMLKVPEYVNLYKKALLECSDSSSGFDFANATKTLTAYQNLIKDYIGADQYSACKLLWKDTSATFVDKEASWSSPRLGYKLLSGDEDTNYFKARQKTVQYYVVLTEDKKTPGNLSAVLPCVKNEGVKYTLIFRPEDFGLKNFTEDLYVRGAFNGWVNYSDYKLTYNSETKSYSIVVEANEENTYKFYTETDNQWFGYKEFKYKLPESYAQTTGDMNFIIK